MVVDVYFGCTVWCRADERRERQAHRTVLVASNARLLMQTASCSRSYADAFAPIVIERSDRNELVLEKSSPPEVLVLRIRKPQLAHDSR